MIAEVPSRGARLMAGPLPCDTVGVMRPLLLSVRGVCATLALLGASACTPDGADPSPGDAAPAAVSSSSSPGVTAPVTTPPGETLPAAQEPERVENLSARCLEAVTVLRDIMDRYDSGLAVAAEDAPKLSDAINALRAPSGPDGEAPCASGEFDRFYTEEFAGWLTPPAGH